MDSMKSSVFRPVDREDTHPHACTEGLVFLTYTVYDEEVGDEVEQIEPSPAADVRAKLRRAVMESRGLQDLRGDLHDLTDVIAGVGIELEAKNMSVRALTAHLIGEDQLRDSLYYGGPAEEGAVPEPPSWVNEAGGRYVERSGGPTPTHDVCDVWVEIA